MQNQKILFLHSAGPQTENEGSTGLLNYLKEHLSEYYKIIAPKLPNPEDPSYEAWKDEISLNIQNQDSLIIIAHSLGGSFLLKYLSEELIQISLKAIYIISAPFWGLDDEWQNSDYLLTGDFGSRLPETGHKAIYHSEMDNIVPLTHFRAYSDAVKFNESHIVMGESHTFDGGLSELVESIKHLND